MANIFSPITDEWTVVDTSRETARRIIALMAAVIVSVVLGLLLGSAFLAFGTRDATAAGRDIAVAHIGPAAATRTSHWTPPGVCDN
jgi:hypothetical protein